MRRRPGACACKPAILEPIDAPVVGATAALGLKIGRNLGLCPPKWLNPAMQRCKGGASPWRRLAFRRRKPAFAVKDEKLFPGESALPNWACPKTGSDRGSLCDHDLTLIVSPWA